MPTITCPALTGSYFNPAPTFTDGFASTGTTDGAEALSAIGDGKFVDAFWGDNTGLNWCYGTKVDTTLIPAGISITGITILIRHRAPTSISTDTGFFLADPAQYPALGGVFQTATISGSSFVTESIDLFALFGTATNPFSGAAWTKANITNYNWGPGLIKFNDPAGGEYEVDYLAVQVTYVTSGSIWELETATEPFFHPGQKIEINGTVTTMSFPIFNDATHDIQYAAPDHTITVRGIHYAIGPPITLPGLRIRFPGFVPPPPITITVRWWWTTPRPGPSWLPAGPPDYGWDWSTDGFAGAPIITSDGTPGSPRAFTDIVAFAAGNAGVLGGYPGGAVVFNNHLIYAARGVLSQQPAIRTFDGNSDRLIQRIPLTSTDTNPIGIMAMLVANGTIYLSTLDSGTNSTNWAGRVFQLDPLSAKLTPIGAPFTGGHVPYALAWHMGRLWVGTNKGDGTAGKLYFFRPNIDAAWTEEHDFGTETAGGCCSLVSFQGSLFAGTDNIAGSRGKIVKRDALSAFSAVHSGAGGAAQVNNGYLYLLEFQSNLYCAYWNQDTPYISIIEKYDGTTFTTVHTGSSAVPTANDLKPYIGMFIDKDTLYVIGGGLIGGGGGLDISLITSVDGTNWTNLTANFQNTSTKGLPMFGVVVL